MKSLKMLSLAGLTLTSLMSACQTAPAPQTGSLTFRVEFPNRAFNTQQIPRQTHQVIFALFEPQSEQPLRYEVLDRENPRVVIAALEAGDIEVMAFAVDAQAEVLSGDFEETVVKASQRQQVILELKTDWINQLSAERQAALKRLLQILKQRQTELCLYLPIDDPAASHCPATPIPSLKPGSIRSPSPANSATPSPTPIPSASPVIGGQSTESPSPVPTSNSSSGSSSGGNSGGGGGSSTPAATPGPQGVSAGSGSANLNTEITVSDGNPVPPPISIETGGQ